MNLTEEIMGPGKSKREPHFVKVVPLGRGFNDYIDRGIKLLFQICACYVFIVDKFQRF